MADLTEEQKILARRAFADGFMWGAAKGAQNPYSNHDENGRLARQEWERGKAEALARK